MLQLALYIRTNKTSIKKGKKMGEKEVHKGNVSTNCGASDKSL